jgi:hypothetical protein
MRDRSAERKRVFYKDYFRDNINEIRDEMHFQWYSGIVFEYCEAFLHTFLKKILVSLKSIKENALAQRSNAL